MDQDNPTGGGGFGTTNSNERTGSTSGFGTGSTNFGAAGTGSGVGIGSASDIGSNPGSFGTTASSELCAHCGQPLHQNAGLDQFLGRIGISEEMIRNLKTQMSNVDLEEYLNTAREYLRDTGDKLKGGSDKATKFAKENPGKVAAGVAVLAVGAGLLINSLRDRSDRDVEIEFQPDPDIRRGRKR